MTPEEFLDSPMEGSTDTDVDAELRIAATSYGIPEDLLRAVAMQESTNKPNALSPKGAMGVMQLMPGTANDMGVTDPYDPVQNIQGGAKYLKQQYDKYGTWELALAAYNAGPGAVDKYGGIPPYVETQDYVKNISFKVNKTRAAKFLDSEDVEPLPQTTVQAGESGSALSMEDRYVKAAAFLDAPDEGDVQAEEDSPGLFSRAGSAIAGAAKWYGNAMQQETELPEAAMMGTAAQTAESYVPQPRQYIAPDYEGSSIYSSPIPTQPMSPEQPASVTPVQQTPQASGLPEEQWVNQPTKPYYNATPIPDQRPMMSPDSYVNAPPLPERVQPPEAEWVQNRGGELEALDIAAGGPVYREMMYGRPGEPTATAETFPQQVPVSGPLTAIGDATTEIAKHGPPIAPMSTPETFPESLPVGMNPEDVGRLVTTAIDLYAYPKLFGGISRLTAGAFDEIAKTLEPIWYRITVRERGLVAQSVDEIISGMKAAGKSEGEIVRAVKAQYGPESPEYKKLAEKYIGRPEKPVEAPAEGEVSAELTPAEPPTASKKPLEGAPSDTQDTAGIPSQERVGEEPLKAEPVESAGEEAVGRGGISQEEGEVAPEPVAPQAAPVPEAPEPEAPTLSPSAETGQEGAKGAVQGERAKEPWEMGKEAYAKVNPHSWSEGSNPTKRADEFDALPDDAEVWVYHATDNKWADTFLSDGIDPSQKPSNLARERYESGEESTFQPGQGLGGGVYVGTDPFSVDGYGRRILAIRVKKKDIAASPEQTSFGGHVTPGKALSVSDGMITRRIEPGDIVDVSPNRSGVKAHEAHVAQALSTGKLTPERAQELGHFDAYPDLKEKYGKEEKPVSKQTPEELRKRVITPEGKTQAEIDAETVAKGNGGIPKLIARKHGITSERTISHISRKVDELGSVEEVAKLYTGDKPVSKFARELARDRFGRKAKGEKAKQRPLGTTKKVYTPKNKEVEVQFAVEDADSLVTSHNEAGAVNKNYPQELQPRDRQRVASKLQIAQMAGNINPELLGDTAKVSDGAPIIGEDRIVESGNARTISLRKAYADGNAGKYREWLKTNAEKFGLKPEDIDSVKKPVLVRIRRTELNREEFTRESNQADVASMSPAELARADAERISPEDMMLFDAPGGNVLASSNRQFINKFLAGLGQQEAAQYILKRGSYTKQLADRIRAAVFAKAYKDDRLLSLMAEDTDNDIRNITQALLSAAPSIAKARAVREDLGEFDITKALIEGADLIRLARDNGQTLDAYLSQMNMFNRPNPVAIEVARHYDTNKKSAKRITEGLQKMAAFVQKELERAANMEMFPRKKPTIQEIVREGIKATGEEVGHQLRAGEKTPSDSDRRREQAGRGRAASEDAGRKEEVIDTPARKPTQPLSRDSLASAMESVPGITKQQAKDASTEASNAPQRRQSPAIPTVNIKPLPKDASRSEIIRALERAFNIPTRFGRFRQKAAGIFKRKEKVVRLAKPNDVEVAAHEYGHHIHDLLGFPRRMPDEVKALAYEGAKSLNREGFAEFVRLYVTNSTEAQSLAPKFYKTFETKLAENPDVQQVLIKARQSWEEYIAAPSVAKVMSFIKPGVSEKNRPTMSEIYTAMVDELEPLNVLTKRVEEMTGKSLAARDDPFMLAWLTRGWARMAEQFVKWGTFQKRGDTVDFTGKSLRDILKPVEEAGRRNLLDAYLVAKRAVSDERILKGFDGILSKEDFEQTVKELEPEFKKVAEDLYKYSDELLTYLTESGRISQELTDRIRKKNLFYAPLYRLMDTETSIGGLSKKKYGNLFNPVKGLKGSSRDIYSPTESLLYNTYTMINVAERNRIGEALIKISKMEGMGQFVEKLPVRMQPVRITNEEMSRILQKYGTYKETVTYQEVTRDLGEKITSLGEGGKTPAGQVEKIALEALRARGWSEAEAQQILDRVKGAKTDEERQKIIEKTIEKSALTVILREFGLDIGDSLINVWRPNYKTAPNEVIFYDKGEAQVYELSPELYKAVMATNAESLGMVVNLLAFPAKTLRATATLTPEFIGRNPIRDQLSAYIYSKHGYVPGYDLIKGIYHIFKKTELYQKFNASGAAHGALVSLDRDYISKGLGEILSQSDVKDVLSKILKNPSHAGRESRRLAKTMVTHPLRFLQVLSELSEEATRVGNFARALGSGQGLLEAGQATRDVTLDFSRIGAKTRSINAITAFWNAGLQGSDKLFREMKNNPKRVLPKILIAITLPSILLALAQGDDEYYQEIPAWRKILFWNIVTHKPDGTLNHIWSIPKPFEVGILFGSVPEMAINWMREKDDAAFKEALEAFGKGLMPSIMPTFLVPVVEWWSEKSWFFGRPTVPRDKENLAPYLQYGTHTSEIVKLVASGMSKIPGLEKIANPSKIENLIYGYTAGLGRLTTEGIDSLIKEFKIVDAPPDPSMTASDIPGLRGFTQRFPSANTRSIERFYDKYSRAKQEFESQRELAGKRGKSSLGAPDTTHPTDLKGMEAKANTLSAYRKMAKVIHEGKGISPEAKRDALDRIYMSMINVARDGLGKKPIHPDKYNLYKVKDLARKTVQEGMKPKRAVGQDFDDEDED